MVSELGFARGSAWWVVPFFGLFCAVQFAIRQQIRVNADGIGDLKAMLIDLLRAGGLGGEPVPQSGDRDGPHPLAEACGERTRVEKDTAAEPIAEAISEERQAAGVVWFDSSGGLHFDSHHAAVGAFDEDVDFDPRAIAKLGERERFVDGGRLPCQFGDHERFEERAAHRSGGKADRKSVV